jgi:hypothetical protein
VNGRTLRGLALFAALETTFADVHPFCDQIVQNSDDAMNKGKPGHLGRAACARHVATYSLVQYAAALGVTSALGYRVPTSSLLAGTALNAITHYVIDRRAPLKRFLRSGLIGRGGYLDHAHVFRPIPGKAGLRDVHGHRLDVRDDEGGPGTALMELDQAAHRVIGVAAALLTAWLAVRGDAARAQR